MTMNVTLTPELLKLVRRRVESGHYEDESEVVRDAIRLMDKHDTALRNNLLNILDEGDRQIAEGRFSEYSFENLLRDVGHEK